MATLTPREKVVARGVATALRALIGEKALSCIRYHPEKLNGFEMSRLLYREYKPDTATRKVGLLEKVMDDQPAPGMDFGALGYLARGSRPDLSGPASILQSRFIKAQVSDIQDTNRVVRLAEAHTNLALPVCKFYLDQFCLVSYGDASGGDTRAERAQAYVC